MAACANGDDAVARLYELLPRFQHLAHLDRVGVQAMDFITANNIGLTWVGSTGEGSWIAHMASQGPSMIEMDVMRTLQRDDLEEVMKADDRYLCLYHIPKSALRNLEEVMPNVQARSSDYRRHGQGEVFDERPARGSSIMEKIRQVGHTVRKIRAILPLLTGLSRGQMTLAGLLEQIPTRLQSLSQELEDCDEQLDQLSVNMFELHGELHGPAMTIGMDIQHDRGNPLRYSWDLVLAFQMEDWPKKWRKAKQEWVNRKRYWPPKPVIDAALSQGCQLVAKPPKQNEDSDPEDTQWRLTFTKMEMEINKTRNKSQDLVYLMLKMLYYTYLKIEIDQSEFPSYALKVCMMWWQEESQASQWSEQPGDILYNIKMVLTKLLSCTENKFLPHYFIPEINLIAEVSDEVLQKASDTLSGILTDVPGHLGNTINEETIKMCDALIQKSSTGSGLLGLGSQLLVPQDSRPRSAAADGIGRMWQNVAPVLRQAMIQFNQPATSELFDTNWNFPVAFQQYMPRDRQNESPRRRDE